MMDIKLMRIFIAFFSLLVSFPLLSIPVYTGETQRIHLSKMNFIYLESQGTIQDTFDEERGTILRHVLQYGINIQRTAILFLDFFGPNIAYNKTYDGNEANYAEALVSRGITVSKSLRFEVTQKYLDDNFGSAYLRTNRKVLVGVLLFPNISIAPTSDIHTIKFDEMNPIGFQAVLPISENDPAYTNLNRIYDRTTIIKYMNLGKAQYLGMLEIYDADNSVLTFLALEGDKEKLISDYAISTLKPGVIN